ncbi:Iron-sulfur cluster assembly protein CIA2 [Spironucleus salmonicida]|uniref:Iron-sulfur cluster assembly protein CIA2 n=1 Tax=Spironucleus salmonicida TaxID=348837 RepID=V6LW37_9EUKA|nr:Iron-sulfur cluster assembly protein CIA2 [Spironucleus salmonicida]|eukprot:EST48463.1 hypothetical protein SS50377_11412 [Spironucleus salmonicida]
MSIVVPKFQQTIIFTDEPIPRSYDGEQITIDEIYPWIRQIRDPEHPTMTLEDLKVVSKDALILDDHISFCEVIFTPTTPTCSMGAILGLSIKIMLMRILPLRFRIIVNCRENTHETWNSLNKQINDKERVLAAMSNKNIMKVVNSSIMVK